MAHTFQVYRCISQHLYIACVVENDNGCRPVEVLRKESLAGLAPSAACRVLSHAYAAVVPITPLPYPPLPLNPNTPG